jgi:hypothetical protein
MDEEFKYDLEELIRENPKDRVIFLEETWFCKLLNSDEIERKTLNMPIKTKVALRFGMEPEMTHEYYHKLVYNGRVFETITNLQILDGDEFIRVKRGYFSL